MSVKILHVDDDPLWWDEVAKLQDFDMEVTSVGTLGEAMKLQKEQQFNVVVCDGSITAVNDGLDWVKRLQRAGQSVILLSTYTPPGVYALNKDVFVLQEFHTMIVTLLTP
jgi:CheY-like chemotaxis protein